MSQHEKTFQQNDVLLNSFVINKKKCHVLLHYNRLVWERENSKGSKISLSISDVISVKVSRRRKTCTVRRSFENFQHNPGGGEGDGGGGRPLDASTEGIDAATVKEALFLNVYYAKHVENSRHSHNQWRKSVVTLHNTDHRIIQLWFDTLSYLVDDQKRPKRILMFVNPYGGRKQAMVVYEKHAKPLFQLAGVDVSCVISQRANQIRDIIMSQSLDQYDAVCCVGGDGTFAEVFNGLIFRTIKELGMDPLRPEYIPKPKLPIGVIPAGSTDTVSYCMHGTTDVRTAVIHIILGQKRGLDLSSVCNSNGLVRMFASVMSYGYLGDVAFESDKFRWMGPKRYDYSGFKKLLSNNGYEGEIVFQTQQDTSEGDSKDAKCYSDCVRCSKNQKNIPDDDVKPISCKNNNNASTDSIDYILMKPDVEVNRSLSASQDTNWKNVRGRFFMISGANISCACSRSPNGFSSYGHLGDGYIDIILVRHTSFFNNIRLLMTMASRNNDIRNLPFVELHRTKKFYFRAQKPPIDGSSINGSCQPISVADNKTSQWNCDGEIIHDSDVLISSHCQLIDVFMRGPYPVDESNKTTGCCDFCKS